jgi:hypothetical protein
MLYGKHLGYKGNFEKVQMLQLLKTASAFITKKPHPSLITIRSRENTVLSKVWEASMTLPGN